MATLSHPDARPYEQLSALVDGELGAAPAQSCCETWRSDPQARASWHAYHLIGDVLRSDDLAADPRHDAAFLEQLRTRLEREPVVLAPAPVASAALAPRAPRRWMMPTAVAAGFVMVVGGVLLGRPDVPASDASATLAGAAPVIPAPGLARAGGDEGRFAAGPVGGVRVAEAPAVAALPAAVPRIASRDLIRDPRLDAYLAAHKQFSGSSALGVPSMFLRGATVAAPRRQDSRP